MIVGKGLVKGGAAVARSQHRCGNDVAMAWQKGAAPGSWIPGAAPCVSGPERASRPALTRIGYACGKVIFQPLILPVSCAAWSWTFNCQVPLATSEEAFTVYGSLTSSAESEELKGLRR